MAKNSNNVLALGVGLNLDPLNQDIANAAKTAKEGMATIADSIVGAGAKSDKPLKETKDKLVSLSAQLRQARLDAQQLSQGGKELGDAFQASVGKAAQLKDQIQAVDQAILANSTTMNNVSQPAFTAHKTGFNGMAMSINQLTREMPAFTYSMQTGFMAISNNIPMFVDQINQAKIANQGLLASGQPVQSVFKQVASSIFSFQTLMGVGITVLTVYGAKIFEWLTAEKAVNEETKRSIELGKQYQEMIAKNSYELRQQTIALKDQLAALQEGVSIDEFTIKKKEAQVVALTNLIKKNQDYNDTHRAHNEEMQMRKDAVGNATDTDEKWGIVQLKNVDGLKTKVQLLKDEIEQGRIQLDLSKQIENIKAVNKGVKEKPEIISHIIKNQYTKEKAGLGDFKVSVPELPQSKIKPTFFDEGLNAALINAKIKVINGMADIKSSLESGIINVVGSGLAGLGEGIAGALSGDNDPFAEFGVNMIKSLGAMAVQLGEKLLAIGVGMMFVPGMQAEASMYLLGGGALVVAGAAVSGLAGRKSQPNPSSSNIGGGGGLSSSMGNNSKYIGGQNSGQLVIEGYIRGNDINFVNGKSGSKNNRNLRFG